MIISKAIILANTDKVEIKDAASKIEQFLVRKFIDVDTVRLQNNEKDSKIVVKDYDIAISVGGDGTVLTCAEILNKTDIPLIAVNMGTFGYIAETSVNEFYDVFNDYIERKTGYVSRMRICTTVFRKDETVFEGSALNDITVSTATRTKIAKLNLSINGTFAAGFKSDGIIVATPTGSTAYNLSAGGPILEETLNNIIINPICSFTLSARPLVIDEKSVVEISIPEQNAAIVVSCDGHGAFALQAGDTVRISRSSYPTLLVRNNKRNSIEVLRDKLGWAGGFNA